MANFFENLFGGGAESEAAQANRRLYNDYFQRGTGVLDTAFGPSLAALQGSQGAYDAARTKYAPGTDLYLDALGVRGPEGNARAQAAFTHSPGFQQGIDTGLQG